MPAPFYDNGQPIGPSVGPGSQTPSQTNTYSLQNASATGGAFQLTGGKYALGVVATGAGTITLQRLGPDGSTWMTAATAVTSSPSSTSADLPPGQYRWAVAGFTAVYTEVSRIPQA